MMEVNTCLKCCGGSELVGFNSENWTPLKQFMAYIKGSEVMLANGEDGYAFLVFSYAHKAFYMPHTEKWDKKAEGTKRMAAFKKYIEDNGLGTVIYSKEAEPNPQMGNVTLLRAGIWTPDNDAIRKFCVKNSYAALQECYDDDWDY